MSGYGMTAVGAKRPFIGNRVSELVTYGARLAITCLCNVGDQAALFLG
jgi:hypothetical protein